MKQLMILAILAILAILSVAQAEEAPASVREGYTTPRFVVPYAVNPPVIDGQLQPDEWQQALQVRALQTIRGTVSIRQSTFWMQWDEDNLYIAMRSPLRHGERPLQRYRDKDEDSLAIFDDSYELWFDVGAVTEGNLPIYTQFLGNFAGGKYDAAFLPTVGIRRMNYEPKFDIQNSLEESEQGRAWVMEARIPRTEIYAKSPFTQGYEFGACLARNYKRPWEQNSVESDGFKKTEHYSRFTLMKDVPAVHLLNVAAPAKETLGVELEVAAREKTSLIWTYSSDSGKTLSGTLEPAPGAPARTDVGLAVEPVLEPRAIGEKPGYYRITVTSADHKIVYLDWSSEARIASKKGQVDEILNQTFDDDSGTEVRLSLILNPVMDYLRVTGDFINYDARDQIARFTVSVLDEAGKKIAEKELKMDAISYVRGTLQLPELTPGPYTSKLEAFGADGALILEKSEPFVKKDNAKEYPWWNTTHGNMDKVLSPWTPVTLKGQVVGSWGREIQVGVAGLPAQVTTQGDALLAGPAMLRFSGTDATLVSGKLAVVSQADHEVIVERQDAAGQLGIQSRVTQAYDGMYKVELTLTPNGPVTLDGLQVVLPFKPEAAEFLYACGAGIRYGYDHHFLTDGQKGRLWDSTKLDGQPMAKGSFIPYLWIGNRKGGLCWFADSDRGWEPSDTTPAIEMRRDSDASTDLVLNLISSTTTLDQPRTIVFAFQATPVRPLFENWRMDTWSASDTFKEWQCGDKMGKPRILAPVPWTFDVERCRKMIETWTTRAHAYTWGTDKYRQWCVPYSRHNELFPREMPEATYFKEHWETKGAWHLYYTKSLNDYMMYHYAKWLETCDLDGIYSDNVRPEACTNIEAGRGYRLPDGRIQPEYNMFGLRRYFLRMRAVFLEAGRTPKIVNHMTNNMIIPWIGAGELAFDGENHSVTPASSETFMDKWSLERMYIDSPHAWGVAVKFMYTHEHYSRWEDKDDYNRRYRAYVAQVLMHDALPLDKASFVARDRFGLIDGPVDFLPFWDDNNGVRVLKGKELYASAWLRTDAKRLLILAVNRNSGDWRRKDDIEISIDWQKLGLPAPADWHVIDAEATGTYSYWAPSGQDNPLTVVNEATEPVVVSALGAGPIGLSNDGTLTVAVPKANYRLLILEARQD